MKETKFDSSQRIERIGETLEFRRTESRVMNSRKTSENIFWRGANGEPDPPTTENERQTEMGMDVLGRNPTGEQGKYFGRTIWAWRFLIGYCIQVAPEVCASCKHWYTNDGDGLDAIGAAALAAALQNEVDEKRTLAYATKLASAEEQNPLAPEEIPGSRFVASVVEFIAFLRESGGFEIW